MNYFLGDERDQCFESDWSRILHFNSLQIQILI